MTPLERAARDRLARYAAPDAPPFPVLDLDPEITHLTPAEATRIVEEVADGIRATLASDLDLVLAALDRHEQVAEHDQQAAQRVRDNRGAVTDRECLDCSARIPNGSACPCTGE
ncbi:MAG TPA: hypothetical protein VN714_12705 [Trebonia sp.]|nr:hypothetical protein [Trebonia sp.]